MISGNINSTYFSVYTYGGEMIIESPSSGFYYFSWTPSYATGTMYIGSSSYVLSSYSGFYSFSVSSSALDTLYVSFNDCNFSYIETNLPVVQTSTLPNFSSLRYTMFTSCDSLKSVNLYSCTSLGSQIFTACVFENINLPLCSEIQKQTFARCSYLKSISLPECTSINYAAFNSCNELSEVYASKCVYIGSNAFEKCSILSSIYVPVCEYISSYAFSNCWSLYSIDLPVCSFIGSSAFRECSALTYVVLRGSSVCSLKDDRNMNAFSGTKIASSQGGIYVPSSLLSNYKSDYVWYYWSTHIYPISE